MDNYIIPLLIGGGVAVAGFALLSDDNQPDSKRVQTFVKEKETSSLRRKLDPDAERKRKMLSNIKDLEKKERQLKKARLSLSAKLDQAGLTMNTTTYWLFASGLGIFFAAIAFAIHQPWYFIIIAAFFGVMAVPKFVLNFLCKRRQGKFMAELAGSVELIVRGVKSGLPLNECLKMIGREAQEPLAGEFRRIVDQTTMGVPLDQALNKMYERMPLSEVSFFSIVLAIQQKAGGNLSEALGNLAIVLRSRRMMREKVNALSSEAKSSAMIIGALPIAVGVLVSITAPDYIKLLFTDKTGHMALMVGAGMMGSGIMVMRKMINFDI